MGLKHAGVQSPRFDLRDLKDTLDMVSKKQHTRTQVLAQGPFRS